MATELNTQRASSNQIPQTEEKGFFGRVTGRVTDTLREVFSTPKAPIAKTGLDRYERGTPKSLASSRDLNRITSGNRVVNPNKPADAQLVTFLESLSKSS